MLNKAQYGSWASRMLLYIKGKEHIKLLDSVLNGPFKCGIVTVLGTATTHETVRERTYDELIDSEKIREGVKLLIEGLNISLHERESKLYDDFDMLTSIPGETIHTYYLSLRGSKFVTNVKLAKDLHNINFDHLYGYLRQHEAHAKEVRLTRQRYSDPIALESGNYLDGRVTVQTVQGRQNQGYAGSVAKNNATATRANKTRGSQTADNGERTIISQESQEIPTPAAFQTNDLDAFDSDYDEAPSASALLMANLSAYDSGVLSE
nr:hypothetical protein [Tanacetum cinerariifolium]